MLKSRLIVNTIYDVRSCAPRTPLPRIHQSRKNPHYLVYRPRRRHQLDNTGEATDTTIVSV